MILILNIVYVKKYSLCKKDLSKNEKIEIKIKKSKNHQLIKRNGLRSPIIHHVSELIGFITGHMILIQENSL